MQIFGEHDHGEWTRAKVFAKVEKACTLRRMFDAKNLATHALLFANEFSGVSEGCTSVRRFGRLRAFRERRERQRHQDQGPNHSTKLEHDRLRRRSGPVIW